MTTNHDCDNFELIQSHTLDLNQLQTEFNYTKKRLDEMDKKIDKIDKKIDNLTETVTNVVNKSIESDFSIDTRVTKLETAQNVIKWVLVFTVSLAGTAIAILAFILTHVH
jgi:archaellum component FlaC